VDIDKTKTVKGLTLQLKQIDKLALFYNMIEDRAIREINIWFPRLTIEMRILK
jgi:hypothetical protein